MKKYIIVGLFCVCFFCVLIGAACKKVISVSGISFSQSVLELYVGDEYQLEYNIYPDNASNKTVLFSCSDEDVVSVESGGKILAVSQGEVTVTIITADGNYSDICVITVKSKGQEDDSSGKQDEKQDDSNYSVTFMAGDEIVAICKYTEDNLEIEEPEPPDKKGYTVEWESYTLNSENITVYAIYTPITYKISFLSIDGIIIFETIYTVESTGIAEPQVPPRDYYSGKWQDYELTGGDIEVNALYTPVEYTVNFIANGETISEQTYTIEDQSIIIPNVPAVSGYSAVWEEFDLLYCDISVYAIYTPIEYVITFSANGFFVNNVTFTIESQTIEEPLVPSMAGYEGEWESYTLICDNFTVKAVYTPVNYTITYANTKGADNSNPDSYNCENVFAFTDITADGYIFEGWYAGDEKITSVNLMYCDLILTAKWSLIKYEIRFVDENYNLITTIYYTVEDSEIVLPDVPVKDGYSGSWSKYELTNDNELVVVHAIYTKIED